MSTTTIRTKYGPANDSDRCRDNWPNMTTAKVCGQVVHLQASAVRAFREACREFARLSGWTEARIKRTGGRAILLTGSWRSCELQAEKHAEDPSRFADPDVSLHPQGLAIDVSTIQPDFDKAHRALAKVGWHRARPDEPWHHSWGFNA